MEQVSDSLIKIIRYVLSGDVPELSETIDYGNLFALAKSHGVENMVYVGLKRLNLQVPEEIMIKFKTSYEMQIMVEATQAIELELIGEAFETAGIDYVPLKGSVVKYLYPMPDYRKSGDIDILVRAEDENKAQQVMLDLGYDIEENDESQIHISYIKNPYIEVEIHRQLTHKADRAYKCCELIWNYVRLKEDSKNCYLMSEEFLYVHTLAHFCRHLYFGGAGVRFITDAYILLHNCKLNQQSVKKLIKNANLETLDRLTKSLVKKWFGIGYKFDCNVERLADIVLLSGSYGTTETRRAIKSSEGAGRKIINIMRTAFPSYEVLRWRYNSLQGKPFLLPWIWVYRIFQTFIYKRTTIKEKFGESFDFANNYSDMDVILEAIRDI